MQLKLISRLYRDEKEALENSIKNSKNGSPEILLYWMLGFLLWNSIMKRDKLVILSTFYHNTYPRQSNNDDEDFKDCQFGRWSFFIAVFYRLKDWY